jgi:3-hydroxyisobutyrate dehydrogenase-like beta-hydroxyacid dehydrogenase
VTSRIGFIGIGMMGHGMAKNLLAKGYPLTFKVNRNRSNIEDLLAAGAK